MKLYKIGIITTFLLTLTSFLLSLYLHYFGGSEYLYWENILLGIFGSSLLALISSIIAYFNERKTTLEEFCLYSDDLLSFINEYDKDASVNDKIIFFMNYYRLNKIQWSMSLGKICFIFNAKATFKYIYDEVYTPIENLNKAIHLHFHQFRWYLDGSGKNDKAMELFIKEIEECIILVEPYIDELGNCIGTTYSNKLVHSVRDSIIGRYFEIMYMRKNGE